MERLVKHIGEPPKRLGRVALKLGCDLLGIELYLLDARLGFVRPRAFGVDAGDEGEHIPRRACDVKGGQPLRCLDLLVRRGLYLILCHVRIRSEEHTSELQSLMRISYAVFCLK